MQKLNVKTYRRDCFLHYDPLALTNETEVAVTLEYHKYKNIEGLLFEYNIKSPYTVKHTVKHIAEANKIQIITEMGVFENESGN